MRVFNLLKTRIEEMEENGDVDGLIHALMMIQKMYAEKL